jgi:hypothetical protein
MAPVSCKESLKASDPNSCTLSETILPKLFGDDYDDDGPRRKVSCLPPVRWAGLVALHNPTSTADSNYDASILLCCSHVLAAFLDTFRSADHMNPISGVKLELKHHNQTKCEESEMISQTSSKLFCDNRGQEAGQWLPVAWNSLLKNFVMLYF